MGTALDNDVVFYGAGGRGGMDEGLGEGRATAKQTRGYGEAGRDRSRRAGS